MGRGSGRGMERNGERAPLSRQPLQSGRRMSNRLANLSPKVSRDVSARILTLDIETRPHEAYVWGLWKQNIGVTQLMERGHVMCFVAKWYGDKEVIFR